MPEAAVTVAPFEPRRAAAWDGFVRASRNGHFLLERGYLEYHGERFRDASVLFLREGRLVALLPAHRAGDDLVSHGGLPFAGLVVGPRTLHRDVAGAFAALRESLAALGLRRLVYTPTPHCYHRVPFDDDRYVLHRLGARCAGMKLSAGFPGAASPCLRAKTARALRSRERSHPLAFEETDDVGLFWARLEEFLARRHGARPVHSRAEMEVLRGRFPDRIRLLVARENDRIRAGRVVYLTDRVQRAQYFFRAEDGPPRLAARMHLHAASRPGWERPWYDLGTSVDPATGEIDPGLLLSKEIVGARGVAVETWTWEPR